jgi:hypothetical protein
MCCGHAFCLGTGNCDFCGAGAGGPRSAHVQYQIPELTPPVEAATPTGFTDRRRRRLRKRGLALCLNDGSDPPDCQTEVELIVIPT